MAERNKSVFENEGEVAPADQPALEGPTAREDDLGAEPGNLNVDDIRKPVGNSPVRPAPHQPGMGANETEDGLSGNDENTRRAGEDEVEHTSLEDIPVFERADLPPRT